MGWFSWNSKPEENNEPSRENRQQCWDARDSYFECLDRANVVKAGEEGNTCTKEKQLYEANCAESWIVYFNQRRIIADAQKERLAQAKMQNDNAKR
ncbi:Cytochrome c oxidase assembly factor 6 [Leucoagaricus sp. SymC.cos]|nr:Cytochrome c oxidase assembly factor 6 [Leucoagaricus sp. SymC.cos]